MVEIEIVKAFRLSLVAGILILINGAGLGVVTKWFPTIMPTLPGTTGNDPTVLLTLSTVGLILGGLIVLAAFILRIRPANRRILGIAIAALSAPSVIMGGGFIIGFLLGIIGGVQAVRFKPKIPKKTIL